MDTLLVESFERLLQGACTPALVREVERTAEASALWSDIEASGYLDLLIPEQGGAGLRDAFPLWLAPTQVVVATITSDADAYAHQVAEKLRNAGLKVETDLRNEKINYKIREHSLAKTPVIAVVGRKEAEDGMVAKACRSTRFPSGVRIPDTMAMAPATIVHPAFGSSAS